MASLAGETTAETVPNLVGLRYTTDIKGNSAYDDYRIVMVEQPSDTVAQGVVINPPFRRISEEYVCFSVTHGKKCLLPRRWLWRCALRRPMRPRT